MSDIPQQLGKYRIRRAIGQGAMGVVYEGFDPVIDRVVAIKTMRTDAPDAGAAGERARRFLTEAKAAGRLNHRHIVGVHDYGEAQGLAFIVMEFVRGRALKSFFAARHPFPMPLIVRLMDELLDALACAHRHGVVHRDVKPDNIFIADDGALKLGDFGIARIDADSDTHAGTVLGTPSHMAPEQIRGEATDARADLYAAGVVLYQFLTGERPFTGGLVAVMRQALTETPLPPSRHAPAIPEAIDAVVSKALAKTPDERFASATEFRCALRAAAGQADAGDVAEATLRLPARARRVPAVGGRQERGLATAVGAAAVALVVGAWPALPPVAEWSAGRASAARAASASASMSARMPASGPAAPVATQPSAPASSPEIEVPATVSAEAPRRSATTPASASVQPLVPPSPEAMAAFREGDAAYRAGRVSEGLRLMERADAMGAPGVRIRLCAIYRRPTAAEGRDFLKDASRCAGID